MPKLDDPSGAIHQALDGPISAPPLSDVLKGAGDLVIGVSDRTRITRADVFLPILLDAANDAGIPDNDITVLFSTGTHSQQTNEQRKTIAGPLAAERVRLVDHDCRADDLVDLGATSAGTPVLINRIAHETDRLIITGVIQLHYFAGFGGGRKGVLPGISAEESIIANHSFTVSPDGGRNPNCRTAKLDGNPLHEDMTEAARMVSPDFLLNVVVNGDREISGVFAGDWEKAHREGCDYVASHQCVPIDELADIVITSPGGFPKDINYIQSHKAYDNAFQAVKPGGTIILAAECRDGLGNAVLEEYLAIKDLKSHEGRLRDRFQISGHTALAHRLKAKAVRTIMMTGLDDHNFGLLGVERARNLDEAVSMADMDDPLVYVMPEGYSTLPVMEMKT